MVPRFLVGLLLFFLDEGAYNGGGSVLIVVDPGPGSVLVALFLLVAVNLNPLRRRLRNSDLVFVLQILESFGIHNLFDVLLISVLEFRSPH